MERATQRAAQDRQSDTRWFGLLRQRLRWGLTWRGWILAVAMVFGGAVACIWKAQAFLAVTSPVACDYLIVEGWIPKYALEHAGAYFRDQNLLGIITVGGPVGAVPDPAADDDTYASTAAATLRTMGFGRVTQMVPHNVRHRDRTKGSAVALRQWLDATGIPAKALTVVTLGSHSRRTRLVYERVFGPDTAIGVISVPHREYAANQWWRYSEGVKEVVSEGFAYVYTRLQIE